MTDAPAQTVITEEDLLRLSANRWVEVVNGELVETDMSAAGYLHVFVIDNLYDLLNPFTKANKLGRIHTDGLHFILKKDAVGLKGSRIPDLCFIRRGRMPKNFNPERPFPGAPDLAVEVMSPGNSPDDILDRVDDYLNAGTEEVWVIYATRREVYRYRRDDRSSVRIYREADVIEAESLFPGLKLAVHDIFAVQED